MRVLLDESVPRQLAPELRGHEVRTVVEAGWAGVQNSELLRRAAAAGFDAFITMDRNLEHQQNIPRLLLGVVVILARDNRIETVVPLAPSLSAAVEQLRPGVLMHVSA